jgi:hypothetical protein
MLRRSCCGIYSEWKRRLLGWCSESLVFPLANPGEKPNAPNRNGRPGRYASCLGCASASLWQYRRSTLLDLVVGKVYSPRKAIYSGTRIVKYHRNVICLVMRRRQNQSLLEIA